MNVEQEPEFGELFKRQTNQDWGGIEKLLLAGKFERLSVQDFEMNWTGGYYFYPAIAIYCMVV